MAHTLCVCSGSLPFRIQPSLVNQVVQNDQSTYFVHTSDGFVSTVHLDVNSGASISFLSTLREVKVLSSIPCIDACSIKEPSIRAVIEAYQVVITTNDDTHRFPLNFPAAWVRIYPYNRSRDQYIVLAFGSSVVSVFLVSQSGEVKEKSPLILNSRISVLDYVDSILAVATIGGVGYLLLFLDGIVGLWSFDQDAWTFIGIQQIVTCRITGINIQKYPLIVASIACCLHLLQPLGMVASFSSNGERVVWPRLLFLAKSQNVEVRI